MWKKLKVTREDLKFHGKLAWINPYLYHPPLWVFNDQTIPKAIFLGLMIAFLPLPGQTVLAAILSYFLRANLPIAVVITWITNPFTFIPINYGIYHVGLWITGEAPHAFSAKFLEEHMKLEEIIFHFGDWLSALGKTFLTGVVFVSLGVALSGYLIARGFFQMRKKKGSPKT